MPNRFVSVGDDFTLPADVKAADANLPARLQDTALNATILNSVPPVVADVLADNPDVISEAVALAQSGAGLVHKTDAGIPKSSALTQDDYLAVELSPSGKLTRGTRKDGTVELPAGARVAGSLTVNEIQDNYIHAVLTPARKVLYGIKKDGRFEVGGSIVGPPTPDPFDVLLIAGQSNATQLDALPVAPEDADPRIFRWNGSSIEAMPTSQTYIGSSFARAYAAAQPPGRRFLLVDAGVGSTGFTTTSLASPPAGYTTQAGGTWDRTLTSDPVNLYSQMITKTQAALAAAGAGARLAAMIWVQGEADTAAGTYLATDAAGIQAAYAAKLDDLITAARSALGAATLPVIIGSMTPYYIFEFATGSTNREKVNYAHMDTPRRLTSTSFVYGPEDMERQGDTIHLSAQGNRVRGRLMIEALYRAKENVTTAKPLPPQNLRASRSGDTVTVKWDAPPARATAFTVEYSINGGAWTALTLPVAIALSATFTATAGQPVKLRAKTTNETGTTHYTREVAL